jgi:hypothetical protein
MLLPLFAALSTVGLIVLVIVLLLVLGSFPLSRRYDWGYAAPGGLGLLLVILLVLVLFGVF